MNWFEKLQFYTKDFTKEETIELVRYIKWVKAEGVIQEAKEIEDLIEKHFTKPPKQHPLLSGELEIIELREELQRVKLLLQNCNGDIIRADRESAALKAALAELIPIAEDAVTLLERHSTRKSDHVDKEWQDIIDRAKKLLNKQPQSESDKTE